MFTPFCRDSLNLAIENKVVCRTLTRNKTPGISISVQSLGYLTAETRL